MILKISSTDLDRLSELKLNSPFTIGETEFLVSLKDSSDTGSDALQPTINKLFTMNFDKNKFKYKMLEVMSEFAEETGKKQISEFYGWLNRNIIAEVNVKCVSCQKKKARFPLTFRKELPQKITSVDSFNIALKCLECGHDSSHECSCEGCNKLRKSQVENVISAILESFKGWIRTLPEQDAENYSTKVRLTCSADYREYINSIRLLANESRYEFSLIPERLLQETSLGVITVQDECEAKLKNWIESQDWTIYTISQMHGGSRILDNKYIPQLYLSGLKLNKHFISDYYRQIVKEQSVGGQFIREEQLIEFVIRYCRKTLSLDLADISDETRSNIVSILKLMGGYQAFTVVKNTINYADRHNRERLNQPTPESLKARVILYLNSMYKNYSEMGWPIPPYLIPLWELIDLYGINPLTENMKFNDFLLNEFDSEESFCDYFDGSASISEGLRDLERIMRNATGPFAREKSNFINKSDLAQE